MASTESRLRIEKVLSLRTDSAAMIESLDAISSFYHENTVEARRCLRQDLEFQNIQLAKKFLAEFDTIRTRVETVEELSSTLQGACDAVAKRVSEADENMKLFMEKASELQDRSNQYSAQSEDITQFLAKFQLTPQEMDVLEGGFVG
jgi:DNA-directed RNA polymerase sigma subunit (sigma70/sigma32)